MILKVAGNNLLTKCTNCGQTQVENPSNRSLRFLEEFQQIENFRVECKKCGFATIYNMNLPETDSEEELSAMPEEEKEHRKLVRELKKVTWKEEKLNG